MSHYRKKPVVIEAFQWDGTIASYDAINAWAGMELRPDLPNNTNVYRDRVQQPRQFGPLLVGSREGPHDRRYHRRVLSVV